MIDRMDKAILSLQAAATARKLYGLDHAVVKKQVDLASETLTALLAAASKPGKYEADVALGLAELLRRHRHHPDVRPAWRQWTWSKRWWVALLFVNIGTPRRAA